MRTGSASPSCPLIHALNVASLLVTYQLLPPRHLSSRDCPARRDPHLQAEPPSPQMLACALERLRISQTHSLRPPALAFFNAHLFCATFPTKPTPPPSFERRGDADASGRASRREEGHSIPPAPQDQRHCLPARTRSAPALSDPRLASILPQGPAVVPFQTAFPKLSGYRLGRVLDSISQTPHSRAAAPFPAGQVPPWDRRVPSLHGSALRAGSARRARPEGRDGWSRFPRSARPCRGCSRTLAQPSWDRSLLQRWPTRLRQLSPICPGWRVSALNDALVSQQMVYSTFCLLGPEY